MRFRRGRAGRRPPRMRRGFKSRGRFKRRKSMRRGVSPLRVGYRF